jgi:hypothetical protein
LKTGNSGIILKEKQNNCLLFFSNIIKKDLGIWWQWLPQGAMEHDANAYMHKSSSNPVTYNVNTTNKKILQIK